MDWGDFLNDTAQEVVGAKAASLVTTMSAAPPAMSPAGVVYREGMPVPVSLTDGKIFGMPKIAVIGGGAALLLLVGFFMMRGK